jgi:hypothetical protein
MQLLVTVYLRVQLLVPPLYWQWQYEWQVLAVRCARIPQTQTHSAVTAVL